MRSLKTGHKLTSDDLKALRPISPGGFEPHEKEHNRKTLIKDISSGEHLTKIYRFMIAGNKIGLRAVEKKIYSLRDWRNIPEFRKHFREVRELP